MSSIALEQAPATQRRVRVGPEATVAIAVVVALTALRSLTPIIEESLNSDEALLGLMAKHLVEGRAFPLHLYSLPHILGITSWIAAPFIALGGATVAMLKTPLLLINVAIAWIIVDRLHRDVGLAPLLAVVASLPFVLAPPFMSHLHYLDAGGGSPEPLLMTLLLWVLRHRPLAFGIVLGIGLLNRPFVGYGVAALLVVQCWDRSILQPRVWRGWLIAAVAVAATWDLTNSLRVWSSARGPGTSFDATLVNPAAANAGFLCFDASTIASGTWAFLVEVFPLMLGAAGAMPWMPYAVGLVMAVMAARLGWVARARAQDQRAPASLGFAIFLLVVGLLAAAVYVVARCGAVNPGTTRYTLLTPMALVGALAMVFAYDSSRIVTRTLAAIICVWGAFQLVDHGQLLAHAIESGPTSPRRALAQYLVANNVRYSVGDYWDAQALNFLTQERVVIASENVSRIKLYQDEVAAHERDAVRIRDKPCTSGGVEAVPGIYWLCPSP